jgi:DNA-binding FadR family transcriptional regulator
VTTPAKRAGGARSRSAGKAAPTKAAPRRATTTAATPKRRRPAPPATTGRATSGRAASTGRATNAPLRSSHAKGRKLGEQLAERIEEEIIGRGWPVGEVLGSEADLIERYGVSRAVFREAIRIVDHHGVAEMRRGPGGGLVVVAPKADAAVRTLSLNLEFLDLTPEQINEARLAIELSCVRATIEHLDDDGRRRIEEFVSGELDEILAGRGADRASDDFVTNDFHLLLADLTANPAMRLFVDILSRVTSRHSERAPSLEEAARDVHRAHSRIAEAILAGDVEGAERRMKRHLDSVVGYLHP